MKSKTLCIIATLSATHDDARASSSNLFETVGALPVALHHDQGEGPRESGTLKQRDAFCLPPTPGIPSYGICTMPAAILPSPLESGLVLLAFVLFVLAGRSSAADRV